MIKIVALNDVQIIVKVAENLPTDKHSKTLISIMGKLSGRSIEYCTIEEKSKKIITPDLMRIAVKRGFYSEFQEDDSILFYIYKNYQKIFERNLEEIDFSEISVLIENEKDEYLKYLLIKLIVNVAIRRRDIQITE
ncbi:hypothetical protein ACFO26_02215 [Lactococcus nasutitermitis]|uniref:Uncharacterized protein n=1 Tax=Lactococcus nasutitermitis TaxID=1652957 RepID=A0ABV9JA71_9LACT|nr:hypothetical protein [Lactococcus nasutitermitis]